MDIKLEQELSGGNPGTYESCLPAGITVFDVTEPVMKPGAIAFGKYRLGFACEGAEPQALLEAIQAQLDKKELVIEKRSKKGVKLFDLKPAIQKADLFLENGGVVLETVLPAGSTLNVNPSPFDRGVLPLYQAPH